MLENKTGYFLKINSCCVQCWKNDEVISFCPKFVATEDALSPTLIENILKSLTAVDLVEIAVIIKSLMKSL